jgi:hypothetical protein
VAVALAPAHTLAGKVKFADGNAFTVRFCELVAEQPPELTVRLMVLFPDVDQLMLNGPALVEVALLAPLPKFHE